MLYCTQKNVFNHKIYFMQNHRENCTFQLFRKKCIWNFIWSSCDITCFHVNSFNMQSKTFIIQLNCDNNQYIKFVYIKKKSILSFLHVHFFHKFKKKCMHKFLAYICWNNRSIWKIIPSEFYFSLFDI